MYVKALYPGRPLILFGHSMGSMVVRKYIQKYDGDIDKLIVCGSPSKNPLVGLGIFLTRCLTLFQGGHHRSNLIQNMALGNYSKYVRDKRALGSPNAWICAHNETVEQYDGDELCGFVFTLNGFENLFCLMRDIYRKSGWELHNRELPIFFIAGSDDPVIMSPKKWRESQAFLRSLGYSNVTGKLYPGLRHEILNEKNKAEVYGDILAFAQV